jgi:hypothetical protein
MKQLLYVMQFTGHGAAVAGSSNQLRARTSSGSCQISTRIGTGGLEFSIQNISGGQASFESEVTVTGENSFVESGHIRFGDHGLRFSTVGRAIWRQVPIPTCGTGP